MGRREGRTAGILLSTVAVLVLGAASASGAAQAPPTFSGAVPLPTSAGATDFQPAGVVCPADGSCLVYGTEAQGAQTVAAVSAGTGTTWTTVAVPEPPPPVGGSGLHAATAAVADLACPAPGQCAGVGSTGAGQGLIVTGSGSSWSAAAAPLPPDAAAGAGANATLDHVACAGPTWCVLIGSYVTAAGTTTGLLVSGAPGSWTAQHPALPKGAASPAQTTLSAVACASDTSCAAVGQYALGNGHTDGLVLASSGGPFSAVDIPVSPGSSALSLTKIVCADATTCYLTGTDTTASGGQAGVLLSGVGQAWGAFTPPLPGAAQPGNTVYWDSVACAPGGECTFFGSYNPNGAPGPGSSGGAGTFQLTGAGQALTLVPTSTFPAGLHPDQRTACPATVWVCLSAWSGSDPTVALGWAGDWWNGPLVLPAGWGAPTLVGLACPDATTCTVLATGSGGAVADTLALPVFTATAPSTTTTVNTSTTTTTVPVKVPKVAAAPVVAAPPSSTNGTLKSSSPAWPLLLVLGLVALALAGLVLLLILGRRSKDEDEAVVADVGDVRPVHGAAVPEQMPEPEPESASPAEAASVDDDRRLVTTSTGPPAEEVVSAPTPAGTDFTGPPTGTLGGS